jgi:Nuclear pore localisation protein NPL4
VLNICVRFLHLQTLRVQSADGTKRLNIDPKAKLRNLHSAIHELFDFSDNNFEVSQQRNFKNHVSKPSF